MSSSTWAPTLAITSRSVRRWRVIAFEPVRTNHEYCQANIALNQLRNVELHACALWHVDATLPLRDHSRGVNASIASDDAVGGEAISVVSLDSVVAGGRLELGRLDLRKMNIEGAELSALRGMRSTLKRFRPRIVLQLNPPMLSTFGVTLRDVWGFFRELGYEIRAFSPWRRPCTGISIQGSAISRSSSSVSTRCISVAIRRSGSSRMSFTNER